MKWSKKEMLLGKRSAAKKFDDNEIRKIKKTIEWASADDAELADFAALIGVAADKLDGMNEELMDKLLNDNYDKISVWMGWK